MSEQPDPNKETPPAIDLSQYVAKTDYDKVLGEKEEVVSTLKSSLDDAQKKLLDPKYIEYLSQQERATQKPVIDPAKAKDLNIPAELTDVLTQQDQRFKNVEAAIMQLGALMELANVEKKYTDFDTVRDDVRTIMEKSSNDLSFEQAYWIAKQHQGGEGKPPEGKPGDPQPKGSEKPGAGSPPPKETEPKKFKNETEAATAALETVRDKYGITGDII